MEQREGSVDRVGWMERDQLRWTKKRVNSWFAELLITPLREE